MERRNFGWIALFLLPTVALFLIIYAVPLGITLIAAHLVLLFWELRHVSGTLAFAGLNPQPQPNTYLPSPDGSTSSPGESPRQNAT